MAFADWLPRNGESRCIGYAMRWLRKTYPWLKWVVSFADATQCGDGTIYRASGFVLTGIKQNNQIWELPDGFNFTRMSATAVRRPCSKAIVSRASMTMLGDNGALAQRRELEAKGLLTQNGGASMKSLAAAGAKPMRGFQLRYIYFLDPTARDRLTVPVIPFSEIQARGAGMYRGQPRVRGVDSDTPADQAGEGGANPTRTLSKKKPARKAA